MSPYLFDNNIYSLKNKIFQFKCFELKFCNIIF